MTAAMARSYDGDEIDEPGTPDHIRERLRLHQSEGHVDVRVIDCSERGYLLESFRDPQGNAFARRHALAAEGEGHRS